MPQVCVEYMHFVIFTKICLAKTNGKIDYDKTMNGKNVSDYIDKRFHMPYNHTVQYQTPWIVSETLQSTEWKHFVSKVFVWPCEIVSPCVANWITWTQNTGSYKSLYLLHFLKIQTWPLCKRAWIRIIHILWGSVLSVSFPWRHWGHCNRRHTTQNLSLSLICKSGINFNSLNTFRRAWT